MLPKPFQNRILRQIDWFHCLNGCAEAKINKLALTDSELSYCATEPESCDLCDRAAKRHQHVLRNEHYYCFETVKILIMIRYIVFVCCKFFDAYDFSQ